MRTREELRAVRALAAEGLGPPAMSCRAGVSRTTVIRWLAGRPLEAVVGLKA